MGDYADRLSLLQDRKGVKELIREIDREIETVVRGEAFYNLYHSYETRKKMYQREIDYTDYCLGKKYKARFEALGLSRNDIESLRDLLAFQQEGFQHESYFDFFGAERKWFYNEVEKELGNNKRRDLIRAREILEEHENYEADRSINKLVRWDKSEHWSDGRFYRINNSPEENERLMDQNMRAIRLVFRREDSSQGERAQKCARLWAELRETGAAFSPEKMKELAQLEKSPFINYRGLNGIVELGRINRELGIIKPPQDKVIFSEYERVVRETEMWEQDERNGKYREVDQYKAQSQWYEKKDRAFWRQKTGKNRELANER